MSDTRLLDRETQAAVLLRENIIAELGQDEQLIADMIEGETRLHEIIVTLARVAQIREAEAEAMKPIISNNESRRDRHKRAAESIRGAIARAMTAADLQKIERPDMTISARISAPRPKCISVEMLPKEFQRVKIEVSADMSKISDHLADTGEIPDGVTLTNGAPILTIRSR